MSAGNEHETGTAASSPEQQLADELRILDEFRADHSEFYDPGDLREGLRLLDALVAEREQLQRSMLLIHTWLGRALEPKQDRFAIEQYVGLIEDAYNEADERVRLDA